MKIKLMIFLITLILIVTGLSGCISTTLGPEVQEYFEAEYAADDNTTISVSTVNGEIEITSWTGDNVTLNATKRTRHGKDDLENIRIRVSEDNNEISIEIQHPDNAGNRAVDLDIKIPDNVTVETATSTNGPIQITNVKGDAILSTTNGPITVEGVDGYIEATTTNGGIDIQGTTGIDYVTSTNGGIFVEIFDFIEDIIIQTTNGGINAYINQSQNANIEIMTVNGGISIEDLEITVAESTSKFLRGTIGDGGDKITIITTNGGINIRELEI
jgi:DUF4097 and DUF4098 domain-containing protein YvlB